MHLAAAPAASPCSDRLPWRKDVQNSWFFSLPQVFTSQEGVSLGIWLTLPGVSRTGAPRLPMAPSERPQLLLSPRAAVWGRKDQTGRKVLAVPFHYPFFPSCFPLSGTQSREH